MSLLLFLVGVFILLYLYSTYKNSHNSERTESNESNDGDYTAVDSKGKLTAVLKNVFNGIIQPYSDRYGFTKNLNSNSLFFRSLANRFQSYEETVNAMKECGLTQCQLIVGIDFTASNEWQGRMTNSGLSLHHFHEKKTNQNPYLHVLSVLEQTLYKFLPAKYAGNIIDQSIHVYGFGDSITKDKSVFNCSKSETCRNFYEVVESYKHCASHVELGGPTSYAPVINKAIEIVKNSDVYHILVIIADGQFVDPKPTADAIVAASFYPLSIIVVGVGDGPWNDLHKFDDWLPQRKFDNFQFVEYTRIAREYHSRNVDAKLALHLLMEVPDQFKIAKNLGYIGKNNHD